MTRWDDLFDKPQPPARPPAQPHRLGVDPERANGYALAALRKECAQVANAPEGTRNHTLNTAAFNLGQLVASGNLYETDVVDNLTNAAHAAGLMNGEIANTIRSGLNGGTQHPRTIPEQPEPPPLPTLVVVDPTAPGLLLNPIIDWHELFAADDDGEEWIIEPLLPARRMVALYSAPKVGKSLLMLEIAVAVARGTEALGTIPDRPRRVLYVDFENDPRGDVRTRLEDMNVGPDQLDNLCYLTYPSLAKFDTAQGALDLMRHVDHYRCELVVIDTVSRSVTGDENDNDTWLAFYRNTGLALKQAGVACIRLDHSGKDQTKGMRGGSAKSGDVDAVWKLTRVNDTTVHLECTDNRMPVDRKHLALTRDDYPLKHRVMAVGSPELMDAKVRQLDALLERLGVPNSASTRQAKTAVRGAGEKVNNDAIQEVVRIRKLRLDINLTGVPGTPPVHPGTPGGDVPGTPPL